MRAVMTVAVLLLWSTMCAAAGESDPRPLVNEDQDAAQDRAISPAPKNPVARSAFTTEIVEREPVNFILGLTNDESRIYYFTELRGLQGRTVYHRWEYEGEVIAEVAFDVKGPRLRVWSSKDLVADWTGKWRVQVTDAAGRILAEDSFEYSES